MCSGESGLVRSELSAKERLTLKERRMKIENVMGEKSLEAIGLGQREGLKSVYWWNALMGLIYRRKGDHRNDRISIIIWFVVGRKGLWKSTCMCRTWSPFFFFGSS